MVYVVCFAEFSFPELICDPRSEPVPDTRPAIISAERTYPQATAGVRLGYAVIEEMFLPLLF